MREEILRKRYYLKDENGNVIEDWDGLAKRVSSALALDDRDREEFYHVIKECLFLPNSPTLMNAGKSEKFSLSACFVIPVDDSMESIFDAVKAAAIIQKSGGGTGFSFSRLRPKGDIVGTTKGVSSGPVSFMKVFDAATETVKQGGTRRGANMGILRVDHPDIEDFIKCKDEEGELENFNISVAITDSFMHALETDREFELVNPRTLTVTKKVKARDIFNLIVKQAWKNGEPGVVFIDRINQFNPTPHLGLIEATNPCGEQPLLPYEACVLGSVNLSKMVKNGVVDWELLKQTVHIGIRMLDNIIDLQHYPVEQVKQMHLKNRKVGLGVMGWADMLIKLMIPYNSNEAIELAEKIMSFIEEESILASSQLATQKGVFPAWKGSVWHQKGIPMRNATTTTIAPTGSISIIAECSSGIEPVFDFVTVQKRPLGEHVVVHPLYQEWISKNGNAPLPSYFVTAAQIPVEWHIRMQAAFQKFTHNAVSKTINLPASATVEDVRKAFLLSYKLGCKGITVYRDGSRQQQVISSSNNPTKVATNELPAVLDAKRVAVDTPEGKVYVHVSFNSDMPVEMFVHTPVESKYSEIYESFARIFSCALRHGVPLEKLLQQLERANRKYGSVSSIPAAIIRAFRMLSSGLKSPDMCPDCGGVLVLEEGCVKCHVCGYSECK